MDRETKEDRGGKGKKWQRGDVSGRETHRLRKTSTHRFNTKLSRRQKHSGGMGEVGRGSDCMLSSPLKRVEMRES